MKKQECGHMIKFPMTSHSQGNYQFEHGQFFMSLTMSEEFPI